MADPTLSGPATAGGSTATVSNPDNGNALSGAGAGSASLGGAAIGDGNGGGGGNGAPATVTNPSFGGDTSSGNLAIVAQVNHQSITQVPVSVQFASSEYNAFSHNH
jgi:hypothetical protein